MMRKTVISLTKPQEVDMHTVGEKRDGLIWTGTEWAPEPEPSVGDGDHDDSGRPEDEPAGNG
jgi:hypothetical protein